MSEHEPKKEYPKTYREASNSDYITAEDLQGREVTVKLIDLDKKDLEGEDGKVKRRFVYVMENKDRRWVSNTTNNICLEAMFGADPKAALGHRVTLRAEMTSVGGVRKLGIRVAGSPDLERDMTIVIRLPRRGATERTLRRIATTVAPVPPPEPPPVVA